MKVRELIEKLSQEDPEHFVMTSGYEGGYEDVNNLEKCAMRLNVNNVWYYGSHERADSTLGPTPSEGTVVVDAIIIS